MSIIKRVVKRVKKDSLPVTAYEAYMVLCDRLGKKTKNVDKCYHRWIEENEVDLEKTEPLEYNPLISIVVPVYNVLKEQLVECIESVKQQTYTNWELCLADDCSSWKCVRKVLDLYKDDPQIKVIYRTENGHISRATNTAIEAATGEFIAFMDCDDILTINALYEMVKKLNENPSYDFIYSDEDKVREDGTFRHMPHFKSDWAPDTLMSNMYTCHFGMYRRSIAKEIGGLLPGYEGAQDYEFTMRFMEKSMNIGHVPKILYHWRERAQSTAVSLEAKPYVLEAARKAKEAALERRGLQGKLELIEGTYQYRVNYFPIGNPLVSIVIPSKDNYEIFEQCIESLYSNTKYKNFEVVHVDNGSNEVNKSKYKDIAKKYGIIEVYEKSVFNFSKMCNIGANAGSGEYLLFLNDDIEIFEEEWLERMLGQAMISYTGAVGAKLYYPASTVIQHMGVTSMDGEPIHVLFHMDDSSVYYFARNRMEFNYSAVTGACLLVNKKKFDEVGGFDENFPVAYNDVDLCFKLYEHGYYNVVRNDVHLYHHESVSRGLDTMDQEKLNRLKKERERLYELHPRFKEEDPFFNKNMMEILSLDGTGNLKVRKPVSIGAMDSSVTVKDKTVCSLVNISNLEKVQQLKIEGHFYWNDYKYNNANRISLILQSKSDAYICKLSKAYYDTDDLNLHFVGNIKLSAFLGAVDISEIPEGSYRAFLKIHKGISGKRYLFDTEQIIDIKK